jgi:hypothetical protein
VLWVLVVTDKPEQHSSISMQELIYIAGWAIAGGRAMEIAEIAKCCTIYRHPGVPFSPRRWYGR